MKASILKKMERYKESFDWIEKALFLDPDNEKAMDIKRYLLEDKL